MPLSKSAEQAQKLLLITLDLALGTHDAQTLNSLIQARAQTLADLEKIGIDAQARQILGKVQEAETAALSTLNDWRGAIAGEAAQNHRRKTAAVVYARAA